MRPWRLLAAASPFAKGNSHELRPDNLVGTIVTVVAQLCNDTKLTLGTS